MPQEPVLVRRDGRVATISINRPERRNALNAAALRQLAQAFESVGNDGQTLAVVLRGESKQAFSSGFEISLEDSSDPGWEVEKACLAIEKCPRPVIAMMYGFAIGGGLLLALACDLRLAADNARVGMTMAKIGIVFRPAGLERFINVVGLPATKRIFLTAELFDANEARAMGLVHQVAPLENLEKATYDLAGRLAENAPLALAGTKASIDRIVAARNVGRNVAEDLAGIATTAFDSEDAKEGRQALRDKRKPVFRGK